MQPVPTGNVEVFEMMEITHLPATRLYVHFANRDLGFSVCLSLPRGCGIGELRPPSPTQCAEALRETGHQSAPREHFDGREVYASQNCHVGLNEFPPCRVFAPLGRRLDAVPPQDVADGLVRHVVTEVG